MVHIRIEKMSVVLIEENVLRLICGHVPQNASLVIFVEMSKRQCLDTDIDGSIIGSISLNILCSGSSALSALLQSNSADFVYQVGGIL